MTFLDAVKLSFEDGAEMPREWARLHGESWPEGKLEEMIDVATGKFASMFWRYAAFFATYVWEPLMNDISFRSL